MGSVSVQQPVSCDGDYYMQYKGYYSEDGLPTILYTDGEIDSGNQQVLCYAYTLDSSKYEFVKWVMESPDGKYKTDVNLNNQAK